jgi:YD repeat-containing protein
LVHKIQQSATSANACTREVLVRLLVRKYAPVAARSHAYTYLRSHATNQYDNNTYDVFGNLLTRIESSGVEIGEISNDTAHRNFTETDLHTTEYRYDAAGRQIQTILPELQIYDAAQDTPDLSNPNAVKTVRSTSTTFYDNLGNAIANQDAAGNYRYKTYDAQGRTTFEIDQQGYVTGYEYDSFDEVTRTTRYATALNLNPAVRSDFTTDSVKAALAVQPTQDRSIQTRYDLLGRVTRTIEPQALLYDKAQRISGSDYASAAKTTDTFYNGYGEAYKTSEYGIDASGNVVTRVNTRYTVRDSRGQKTAELSLVAVDSTGETGYLTTWDYDAFGNITQQSEYANSVKAAPAVFIEAARLGTGFAPPTADINDRVTRYEYDYSNHHRKTSETRKNVLVANAGDLSANAVNARGDITTEFSYDKAGNLILTKDNLGRYTASKYNQQGYVIAVLSNFGDGNQPGQLSEFKRDAHGNILQRIDYVNGGKGTRYSDGSTVISPVAADKDRDRVTQYRYDQQNHLIQTTDALGNTSSAAYDVLGHLAKQSQLVTNVGFTSSEQVVHLYQYDAAGHQSDDISHDARDALTANSANLVRLHSDYNGFGELTRKTRYASDLAGAVYETNQYDNAGHLFKTNAGDGVDKIQLFDINGRLSAIIRTKSSNAHDIGSEDDLGLLNRDDAIINETRYDLAGRAISQISDSSHLSNSSTISQTVDRWGNVISRSDPRNAVTGKNWRIRFAYDKKASCLKPAPMQCKCIWPGPGPMRYHCHRAAARCYACMRSCLAPPLIAPRLMPSQPGSTRRGQTLPWPQTSSRPTPANIRPPLATATLLQPCT